MLIISIFVLLTNPNPIPIFITIIINPYPKTINTILARPTDDHPWRRSQRKMHDDNVNAKCAINGDNNVGEIESTMYGKWRLQYAR